MRLAHTTTGWVSRCYLRFPTSILVAVLLAASKWTFTGAPLCVARPSAPPVLPLSIVGGIGLRGFGKNRS